MLSKGPFGQWSKRQSYRPTWMDTIDVRCFLGLQQYSRSVDPERYKKQKLGDPSADIS